METKAVIEPLAQPLKEKILRQINEQVMKCYQCGKCAAGCPLAGEMDCTPNQILRLLQIGSEHTDNEVLSSYGIWLCLTCDTCHSRCPQEVDFPHIMDFLRGEAIKRNKIHPKAKEIIAFHKSFLESIESNGRLNEVELTMRYKLKTLNLLQDIGLAPKMFAKGKLEILPHKIKGKDAIARIFANALKETDDE